MVPSNSSRPERQLDRRARPRVDLYFDAGVRIGIYVVPAAVIDISTHGCALRTALELPVDQTFVLTHELLGNAPATITWSRGFMSGAQFDRPVTERDIAAVILQCASSLDEERLASALAGPYLK